MCVKVVNTGQEILSVKSTVEFYNGENLCKSIWKMCGAWHR